MTLPVKPINEIEEKAQVWADDRILILDADSEEARLASKDELKGDKWDQWEKWDTWDTWPQWPKGDKWDKGDTWAKWDKGDKGDTWDEWPTWPQGSKWDKWDKGDTWSQWPKWETWDEWPQGETWPQGVSVTNFQKVSGTWAAGTSDTYQFTLSNGQTFQFSVYNWANGEWSGDMIAANNLSDLTNFVTARTNLSVYSKAEIDTLLSNFWWFVVVATLPTTDIKSNVIYLKWPIGTGADKYEEWIYYSSTWTKIWETSVDLSPFLNLNTQTSDVITEWTDNLFLTAAERTKLSNTSGTNTWDQSASDFDIKDLADTTWLRTTWNNKQDALTTQTAYTSKWTSTKVPTITTNTLGQVTEVTETSIEFPVTSVNGDTWAVAVNEVPSWWSEGDVLTNVSGTPTWQAPSGWDAKVFEIADLTSAASLATATQAYTYAYTTGKCAILRYSGGNHVYAWGDTTQAWFSRSYNYWAVSSGTWAYWRTLMLTVSSWSVTAITSKVNQINISSSAPSSSTTNGTITLVI